MPITILSATRRGGRRVEMIWRRSSVILGAWPLGNSPRVRADSIRARLAEITADLLETDTLTFAGVADFGADDPTYGGLDPLYLPAAKYYGLPGVDWFHNIQIDAISGHKPFGTTGFVLPINGNVTFNDFTLRCTRVLRDNLPIPPGQQEDQGIICWNNTGNGSVTFTSCLLDAGYNGDWAIYNWTPGSRTVIMDSTRMNYCRFGVAMVQGNGDQTVVIRNGCSFYGDANNGNSMGDSSDPTDDASLSAVLMRNGTANISDSYFEGIGLLAEYDTTPPVHTVPRICSIITDRYATASAVCNATVTNCQTAVTLNLCPVGYDVDIRDGNFYDGGGNTGIGVAGALKVYGE